MKKFLTRTITVVTVVPALVAIIVFAPWYEHLVINLIAVAASVIGAYEASALFAAKGNPPSSALIPVLGAAFPLATYLEVCGLLPSGWTLPVLAALVSIILAREIFVGREQEFGQILPRIAASLTILVYPGLFVSYFIRFSLLPDSSLSMIVFLLIVFGNDILAYLAGSLWGSGSRRLLPVSPNKSLVGFVGGIAGSTLFATAAWLAVPQIFFHNLALLAAVTLTVALATIIGDLVESAMKRSAAVKDSGWIIPGRGGILDSIDSVIFASPICFYLLARGAGIW